METKTNSGWVLTIVDFDLRILFSWWGIVELYHLKIVPDPWSQPVTF